MARKTVDQCLICYPDPCTCFAPKARAKRAPKAPPIPDEVETPQAEPAPSRGSGAKAAMKAAAAKTALAKTESRFTPPREPKPLPANAEDVALQSALRALSPIMASEERKRYKMIVDSTPTVTDRTIVWRMRHGQE